MKSLDEVVVTINQTTPDTVYFGSKFKVDVIANKANEISLSLSPEANQGETVFDTTILNASNSYIFSKEIEIPADGSWSGDYLLKVRSGAVEKTRRVHFREPVGFPTVYVPGAHQGWDPAAAPTLVSSNSDESYEGYVYFANPNTEFKIATQPNWDDANYGDGGNGTLSTDGGNLTVAEAGYYLIQVNLADSENMTWSATKTNWGAIGNATAAGWDADQDLTFSVTEGVWKATLPLTVGELKFRANDAWDINLGDTGMDGLLENGGDNIQITTAGNYEVILDLRTAGMYTYTLRQL